MCCYLLIAYSNTISAQIQPKNDSIWCDHLNEIIKCASMHQITDRICHIRADSDAIAPFVPMLKLTDAGEETMNKQYGKVNYTAICYTSAILDDKLGIQYESWYYKVIKCLSPWEVSRLANQDKSITKYLDYFFTNSEDETTLRLDIVKVPKGYAVRIRIF
jgi:hypothetical protein